MAWASEELEKIAGADELHISTMRPDGSLRNPVTIWVVRANNDLYIRSVKGPEGKWFRHALERHQSRIDAGGVSKDVAFEQADDSVKAAIDKAYQDKYHQYGDRIVGSTLTSQAKAATLKLIPLF